MAAMILSGSAVQTKGFGLLLTSSTKAVDGGLELDDERKTPRWRRRLVSLANDHG